MDKLGDIISFPQPKQPMPEQSKQFILDCESYDAAVAEAKAEIFKLISLMVSPGSEQDPETKTAIFWDILKTGLSPENVSKVCRSAMRGSVSGSKFLPTPAELISYANQWFQKRDPVKQDPRLVVPLVQPRISAGEHKLLPPIDKPNSEDERARIARNFKNLAADFTKRRAERRDADRRDEPKRYGPVVSSAELRAMDTGEREKHKIEAEDYLEKLKNIPLPKLSPRALATFMDKGAAE